MDKRLYTRNGESVMISDKEQIEHEAIKNIIKMGIINNPNLNDAQKQQAIDKIDRVAQQADWLIELLRQGGYIE